MIHWWLQVPPGLYHLETWSRHHRSHDIPPTSGLKNRAWAKLEVGSISKQLLVVFGISCEKQPTNKRDEAQSRSCHSSPYATGSRYAANTGQATVRCCTFSTDSALRLHNSSILLRSRHFTTPEEKHTFFIDTGLTR